MPEFDLGRRLTAEFVGTAFLLATVVGSGIMAERLADGNLAIALLGNTFPTGAILVVLILLFGPVSGAHFNPAVTLAFALRRQIDAKQSSAYVMAQVVGGMVGVVAAHLMFEIAAVSVSSTARTGSAQWFSEAVAYVWFSGANPAVTVSRALTDTFSGIAPAHVPAFVIAQLVGASAAVAFFAWLLLESCAGRQGAPDPESGVARAGPPVGKDRMFDERMRER